MPNIHSSITFSTNLFILGASNGSLVAFKVVDLQEIVVHNVQDVLKLIERGMKVRLV